MLNTRIYNYIDEERKFMGLTLIEIITPFLIMVFGFLYNRIVTFTCVAFTSVFIIKYLKDIFKKSRLKRRMFFILSDLMLYSKNSYYFKYYL